MNARGPEFVRVNEQTLVKSVGDQRRFITFWKNVHQQRLVSKGVINGSTYTVESTDTVTREEGNSIWREHKADGWVRIEKSEFAYMTEWLGTVLW